MQEIDVQSAISEIHQACEGKPGSESPFFFIVGAGISAPAIPIASEIEAECKAIALAHNRRAEPKSTNAIGTYSHWFELAFPQPAQRQKYLRDKIEDKPISPAVFRLAHLLLDGAAGKLVVTPNFDDFLSRALTLFGEPPILCDHPHTIGRIAIDAQDVQIVHVHGTYWFYDCCNLQAEIAQRAENLSGGPVTISSFLEHLLWDRSPIVLGYSGWEGDVIMTALQRRLRTPMPHNLYWFGYRRSDLESLPAWLRSNANVRVIAPQPEPVSNLKEGAAFSAMQDERPVAGAASVLPAKSVLDLLVSSFELDPPPLTKEPLKFFAAQLGKSVFREESGDSEKGFYALKSVVNRVQAAAEWLARTEAAPSVIDRELEDLRNAVRSSDYKKAIEIAKGLRQEHADRSQLEEILNAAQAAASSLRDHSVEALEGCNVACQVGERLFLEDGMSEASSVVWAKALNTKGLCLQNMKRQEDALTAWEEVVKRFGDAPQAALREQVAWALTRKGWCSWKMERHEGAIRAWEEVVKRFADAPGAALREQVAWALYNKGYLLGRTEGHRDAVAVLDELDHRFGKAVEPHLQEVVANGLLEKARALRALNRHDEAMIPTNEILQRYGESAEATLLPSVAMALTNKARYLVNLKQVDEAIAGYDEVLQRFGESTLPAMRRPIVWALVYKGSACETLSRIAEAIATYTEVVQRFANDENDEIQENVVFAKRRMEIIRGKAANAAGSEA